MAVIGKIRKHSGLIVITVGIALAAFVLGDFVKQGPSRSNFIGEVDGEEITYQEFARKVDENINIEKQNKRVESLTPVEEYGVRHRTWDQMIYDIVMGNEFEKLGVGVTTEELNDLVQGNHPHPFILQYFTNPETGQFDRQRVIQTIQSLPQMDLEVRRQWVNFEQAIKKDQTSGKYNALLVNGYFMPGPFAEKIYNESETEAIVRIIGEKFFNIPDSLVSYTEKEVEQYYEENKYKYEQTESVDFDYVVFEVRPSATDHRSIRMDVDEIYEEFKASENVPMFVQATSDNRYDSLWYTEGELPVMMDSIMMNSPIGTTVEPYIEDGSYHMSRLVDIAYRPDSMKASHVLIAYVGAYNPTNDQTVTRSRDEAKLLADSLFNLVERNPGRLSSIALEFSDDPSVRQNEGNFDWFADQTMVYQFNEAVVNGRTGDVSLVESPFGYHIIKVGEKKPDVKKVRVAIIDRSIDPSNKTVQDIYTQASVFAGENNTEEKFEQAIVDQGMAKRSAPKIAKMTNNVPGVENPRQIIRWAFDENVNVGDISPVFDLDGRYLVAILKDRREKGFMPLEDVRTSVEGFVSREKKAEFLKNKMNALTGNIYQMGQDLGIEVDTITVAFGSANLRGVGREPAVVGTIFTLEPGVISQPIAGNAGVYRIIVDEIIEAAGTQNYSPYITPIINNFNSRIDNNYVYRALEEKAGVEDNRILYY